MRKNKLFTALAAATLLVGTGAEVAQATNPTIVQAAKKSKKKAKKTSKKAKTYTITLKRKPKYYETVVSKQNGKSVAQFKRFKNKKIIKKFKLKKGSKIRVLQSVTTYGGDKYYALGYVMVGKKKHSLYIKDSDVKSHSKGIPNVGKKADTSSQNQTQTVTLQVKRPTIDQYTKYATGTVKQDTSDMVTTTTENDKTTFTQYKDSNNNAVKWNKGKQVKIYATTSLSATNKTSGAKQDISVYVAIEDGKYVFIPTQYIELSGSVPDLATFNSDYETWYKAEYEKNKEQAEQDYIADQKAKQEQAEKDAAAKKAAKKAKTSKKKSAKKSKKSKKSSKKTTKKSKKASKK